MKRCSRCGSNRIYINDDGDIQCSTCGHIQYKSAPVVLSRGLWGDPIIDLINAPGFAGGTGCRRHPGLNCLKCPEKECVISEWDFKGHQTRVSSQTLVEVV